MKRLGLHYIRNMAEAPRRVHGEDSNLGLPALQAQGEEVMGLG